MNRVPERELLCCIDRDVERMVEIYENWINYEKVTVIVGTSPTWEIRTNSEDDSFVDAVVSLSKTKLGERCNVIEANIHSFDVMMRTINAQIKRIKGNGNEPYISIAGGTGEYCAAASIMGMTHDNVKIISRQEIGFNIKIENEDDEEENIAHAAMEGCVVIDRYYLPQPDMVSLIALKEFNKVERGKRTSKNVIHALIKNGIWYDLIGKDHPLREFEQTSLDEKLDEKTRKDLLANEKNIYRRKILEKWLREKWVEENDRISSGYEVSDKGARMLYIFTDNLNDSDSPQPMNKYIATRKPGKLISSKILNLPILDQDITKDN